MRAKIIASIIALAIVASGGYFVLRHSNGGRSASAYCSTFYGDGQKFRSEYSVNFASNPIKNIVNLISAPQQLATFFGKLAAVSPMDIEPSVVVLQHSFQREADSMGVSVLNPLAGLASGLVTGVEAVPATSAVNSWTLSHCGPPPNNAG